MVTTEIPIDGQEVIRIVEALALLVVDEFLPGFCVRVSFSADPTALRTVDNAVVANVATLLHVCLPEFIFFLPYLFLPHI